MGREDVPIEILPTLLEEKIVPMQRKISWLPLPEGGSIKMTYEYYFKDQVISLNNRNNLKYCIYYIVN